MQDSESLDAQSIEASSQDSLDAQQIEAQASKLWLENPDARKLMPARFAPDECEVIKYLQNDCSVYNQLPNKQATCKAIILAVLERDGSFINRVLDNVLHAGTMDDLFEKAEYTYDYDTVDELRIELDEYMLLAVRSYPKAVVWVERWDQQEQAGLLAKMVKINGEAIRYVAPEQRTARLVLLAMPTFKHAKNYAVGKLRSQIDSMRDFDAHADMLAKLHDLYPD